MSEGLIESNDAYVSSLAEVKSNDSSGLSKILPSTTISGSAEPLIDVTPRKRIDVPEPKLPELATMSRPAIFPCRASSADVKERPSTSFMSNVCLATETSFSGITKPPERNFFVAFTTTSFKVFSSSISILNTVLSPMGTITVLYPIYETFNLFFVLMISMEKLPLISV